MSVPRCVYLRVALALDARVTNSQTMVGAVVVCLRIVGRAASKGNKERETFLGLDEKIYGFCNEISVNCGRDIVSVSQTPYVDTRK